MIQISFFASGQNTYKPHSECTNNNAFLSSSNLTLLKAVVDTVMPDGTIYIDPEKLNVTGEPDEIYSYLGLNSNTSFQFVNENKSFFDKDITYIKYKQLFRGLEVEGGGYTAGMVVNGSNGSGPDNPCLNVFMIVPYILSEINVPIVPQVSEDQIQLILPNRTINTIELILSHNIDNNCNYNLVWRVNCNEITEAGGNVRVNVNYWVDAINGAIRKRIESQKDIQAPTETYGNQMLNDVTINGQTRLISPDDRLRVYNFGNIEPADPLNTDEWVDNLIPTTNNANWGNEATAAVYQTFYVGSRVLPLYETIQINFNHLTLGVYTGFGASSPRGSTVENAFIKIGRIESRTTALFDVIAHEMGHTYLNGVPLNYSELGNASLHEGMSDILGTYIESLHQGNIDWIIADDETNIGNLINRDLENPVYDCLTDPLITTPGFMAYQYQRGLALGHWYFLVSHGDNSLGINALGNLLTLQILLESANRINPNADIPDLMKATLNVCIERFGRCSQQFLSCQRAWENICVNTSIFGSCSFNINGPISVCEETNSLWLTISGGLPSAQYRWRIIGSESSGFSAFGLPLGGNTYEGGNTFQLTQFPTFDYYPQLITIEVYSPSLAILGGNPFSRKLIKFIDCDHDDPTCDEYNNSIPMNTVTSVDFEKTNLLDIHSQKECYNIEVYDILGHKKYSGIESDFKFTVEGVYFIVKHDNNGKIISVNKYCKF